MMATVLLPIGILTVVWNLKPFWFAILGFVLFRENLEKIEVLGMVLCFGALVLMTYSSQHQETGAESQSEADVSTGGKLLGLLFIFIGSWTVSGMMVANRLLKGVPDL